MQIHFILQGKGGVGKSFIASLITQYYLDKNIVPVCVNTDSVNNTFGHIKAFNTKQLNIVEKGEINTRKFDDLVTLIDKCASEETEVMVIDNGASTFVPFCTYMVTNEVINYLEEQGYEVFLHTVIVGGESSSDTLNGFASLAKSFPYQNIVLWENQYFGLLPNTNGNFEDTAVFKQIAQKVNIYSKITIPEFHPQTYGFDLRTMFSNHLTFEEANNSPDFNVMAKQRLRIIWRGIKENIERAKL